MSMLKKAVVVTKEVVIKKGNYELARAISDINYLIKTQDSKNQFNLNMEDFKILSVKFIRNHVFINYTFNINQDVDTKRRPDILLWLIELFGPMLKFADE